MRIEVRFKDEASIISLSGRFLAGSDGPFLRQKVRDLIEAGATRLVIDFGDVPYIDSTGLGFLAGTRVSAQNAGVRMVLANLNPHVRRVLDEVRLSQFFLIADNEAAAIALAKETSAPPAGQEPPGGKVSKRGKRPTPAPES